MIILCPKIFSFCERGGKARALRHAEGAKGRETSAAAEGGDRRHAPVRGSGADGIGGTRPCEGAARKRFFLPIQKNAAKPVEKGFFPLPKKRPPQRAKRA